LLTRREQHLAEVSSGLAALPADAIRSRDAIALLAGKSLKANSTPYIRHQARLMRAARRGQLTEYRLAGPSGKARHLRYYSRVEVLALRARLDRDGFTTAAASATRTVRAIVKRAELEGLIPLAAAAELAGVGKAAARKWAAGGRFGACKIDGLWFFERAQVAAYRRPAPRQPRETVRCALCGEPFLMKAAAARKARTAAAAAESDELLVFCSDCWVTSEARSLAHSRRVWRRGYSSPGRSRGIRAQWAEGQRDVEAHRERTTARWRSPKKAVEQAERSTQARYGHPLSDPRKVARDARRRGQASTDRSQQARTLELQVRELWPTGATQMAIANEVHVTPQRLGQIVRDLGLPPRPRGRPRGM
jgi:hypothetical protein